MKALKKKTKRGRSQDYKRNSQEKHEIAYRKSKLKPKTIWLNLSIKERTIVMRGKKTKKFSEVEKEWYALPVKEREKRILKSYNKK